MKKHILFIACIAMLFTVCNYEHQYNSNDYLVNLRKERSFEITEGVYHYADSEFNNCFNTTSKLFIALDSANTFIQKDSILNELYRVKGRMSAMNDIINLTDKITLQQPNSNN